MKPSFRTEARDMPRHDPAYLADSLVTTQSQTLPHLTAVRYFETSRNIRLVILLQNVSWRMRNVHVPMYWLTAHASTKSCSVWTCLDMFMLHGGRLDRGPPWIRPSKLALIWIWLTNPSRWLYDLFNPLSVLSVYFTRLISAAQCWIISTFQKSQEWSNSLLL